MSSVIAAFACANAIGLKHGLNVQKTLEARARETAGQILTHESTNSRHGPCARTCARTTTFLFVIRNMARFRQNRPFSFARAFRFETQSDVLKSMISQS